MIEPQYHELLSFYSCAEHLDVALINQQVVINFLFSAYLTLLLAIVQFLLPPYRPRVSLDRDLQELLIPQHLRLNRAELFDTLTQVVESAILLISDLQLITSLAILISGYVQLLRGVSLYLWDTIVELAWFSALTHLATLTSLRHFFRSRPTMATGRVVLMGLILVLLSVACVPTGFLPGQAYDPPNSGQENMPRYRMYDYFRSVPALCLYSTSSTTDVFTGFSLAVAGNEDSYSAANWLNAGIVGLSIGFLVIAYITRVIRIYLPLSRNFEKWFRLVPMDFLQKRYRVARDKTSFAKCPFVSSIHRATLLMIIVLAEAFYEIGNSMLWEILWLSAALVWGTLRLVELRQYTNLVGPASWGFGQVLALSLCVLPIWDSLNNFFRPRGSSSVSNQGSWAHTVNPNQRDLPILEEIKTTAWFRSLMVLILGMATAYAAATLFCLPASAISNWTISLWIVDSGLNLGLTLLVYVMNIAFGLLILVVFILVCLAFHFRHASNAPTGQLSSSRLFTRMLHTRRRLRKSAWCLLVFVLLAVQVAFAVVLGFFPGYVLAAILPIH